MRKLKHVTEICRELYEQKGSSAVYEHANSLIKKGDANIKYLPCKPCDASTPHFIKECLICGQ